MCEITGGSRESVFILEKSTGWSWTQQTRVGDLKVEDPEGWIKGYKFDMSEDIYECRVDF